MLAFDKKAKLIDIVQESPSVKRFFLQCDPLENFHFKPGQFVVVSFPDIDHMFPYRSYSIASAPLQNTFELCVVLKEDGAATPLLFEMKTGEMISFTQPLGGFVLPQDLHSDMNICMICTGTGVAPFRSMIQYLVQHNWPVGKVELVFGCRTQSDLLYRNEWEELQKKESRFTYTPVLSREKWSGLSGYVHQVFLQNPRYMNKEHQLFYICGWKQMVKEAKNHLKDMGYSRKEIFFELYD